MTLRALADLVGVEPEGLRVNSESYGNSYLFVSVQSIQRAFLVEYRNTTSAASVAVAAKKAKDSASVINRQSIPLVAVPFMGEVGKKACADQGVGWFDLSGNAHMNAPGIRIVIEGRPNRFISVGRPENLFAPKSSRIARWLLENPQCSFRQKDLAIATGLDQGYVSRLMARLAEAEYVVRSANGTFRVNDPALLLESWRERYRFSKHTLHKGYVAARSGDELLRSITDTLGETNTDYAVTGLSAAWILTGFASFRIVTIYLHDDLTPELCHRLRYTREPRGANLWLVVPNDDGVFHGAGSRQGIQIVHPVQAYLDLKDHPERAAEASQRLRAELLNWEKNAR
jgi:hypothetical protein